MMRNIKVLGTAIVAVLAMGAIFASLASAAEQDLTAEVYPATLTGNIDLDEGAALPKLVTTAGSVECKVANLHATLTSKTVPDPTDITATPTFNECTCIGVACTIDVNGCTYTITNTAALTSKVDLVCPVGKEITLTSSKCTIHLPPQEAGGHVVWTKKGEGKTRDITGHITLENIKYSHTTGEGIGKCTTGSGTTGTLNGKVTVRGYEDPGGGEGAQQGIFFS